MALLAAYEDFTRRESVSLRDGNFELMLKLQDKKAKVIAQLSSLDDSPNPADTENFNSRIAALLEQEQVNGELLEQKMSANRQEYRRLTLNAISANKLRRAYSAPAARPAQPGSLKGRA